MSDHNPNTQNQFKQNEKKEPLNIPLYQLERINNQQA